ncbi:MAG TPA: DUF4185 domain-containing protein [Chthonomonadales bacterium]|nr:DUF4185 domain-containing protein [Chthonomonadales bacterium]
MLLVLLCPLLTIAPLQAGVQEVAPRQDVEVVERARKLEQLIGDRDFQTGQPTRNRTAERYGLDRTDLGVPFRHRGRTYLLFGDTHGVRTIDLDAIAWTDDRDPEDGLRLSFVTEPDGKYRPVTIPGISQGAFEVPMEGISIRGRMYVYHTTGHAPPVVMGRSVLAVSEDDGVTFRLLHEVSRQHFINVSVVSVDARQWRGLPWRSGRALVILGSGQYRHSALRLAVQREADIERPGTMRFFAGRGPGGEPLWSDREGDAVALFPEDQAGEISLSWNRFLGRWVLLYNSLQPLRGIVLRTAERPWGPWSPAQLIFEPWADRGYGHFMHVPPAYGGRDRVHDPNREGQWGGEYGPYQFREMARGRRGESTIYFTLSTWNPYTVVLMRARLRLAGGR